MSLDVYKLNLNDGKKGIAHEFLCIASSVWHRASEFASAGMPNGQERGSGVFTEVCN